MRDYISKWYRTSRGCSATVGLSRQRRVVNEQEQCSEHAQMTAVLKWIAALAYRLPAASRAWCWSTACISFASGPDLDLMQSNRRYGRWTPAAGVWNDVVHGLENWAVAHRWENSPRWNSTPSKWTTRRLFASGVDRTSRAAVYARNSVTGAVCR